VVRRYAVQMGGGLLAGVWNAVVTAGIARVSSFVLLALLAGVSTEIGEFVEQALLWVFAGYWLIAILRQQELADYMRKAGDRR